MRIHKVPNKQELENFIRKNDLEVGGIYDKDSAIRHFRNTSNQYKAERDTLIDDIAVVRANNKRLEEELKRRREETDNLEAKLSAQLSMKKDLEKENTQLKERINKAEELIEGNIETLKMYGGIISKNYELEKENEKLKEYMKEETFYYQWQNCIDENKQLRENHERNREHNKKLIEENKQLKEKIDTSQVSRLIAENERQNEIIEKYREQNIELRNDLGQLKQELEDFHYTRLKHKEIEQQITALKQEKKALRLQADTYFDEWQNAMSENESQQSVIEQFKHDLQYTEWEIVPALKRQNEQQTALLKDFSKFIDYKLEVIPANATYKHYRSELDKLGVK